VNYGVRYDTTFGLFNSNGGDQRQNPAVFTIATEGLALPTGVPMITAKLLLPTGLCLVARHKRQYRGPRRRGNLFQ